jgi:hypothetical protein
MGSDDKVSLSYTDDNGQTWNPLMSWTVADGLSNTLTNFSAFIPTTGSAVQFGIIADEGGVNDIQDYDFHIDNFEIRPAVITGFEYNRSDKISIYPNPTNGLLNIHGFVGDLTIIDITGKTIFKHSIHGYGIINMSGYAPGVYFIKLESSGYIKTEKFVLK